MISAVVPAFNEEESFSELYGELTKVLPALDNNYEIIFIDDGSTDNSLDVLKKIAAKDKKVRIFSFRKHRGKADALIAGFRVAKGDYIFTMDSDLEDKPSEMLKLYKKIKEGNDVVVGWRKNRKHSLSRVISSRFSNFVISLLWGFKLHDHNCGLKVFTKDAAKSLRLYGGLYRFMLLLVYLKGFKVAEVEIVHQNRKYGKSKYGFFRLWRDVPDALTIFFLTKFGERPLHFFGFIGGIVSAIGLIILTYLAVLHFQGEKIGNRPLLTYGVLFVVAGFQILFTGFLADLILHISQKGNHENEVPAEMFKYKTE
ncbi:MAG TPA: glycosyltransferase family 2 protein [Patescibacteria group bacterium]|jgi:glycosyltransferase involved in cell wall biosynthesis|nr:glycosyltransferase family 2 protein [Patescibacteria group bacterium]